MHKRIILVIVLLALVMIIINIVLSGLRIDDSSTERLTRISIHRIELISTVILQYKKTKDILPETHDWDVKLVDLGFVKSDASLYDLWGNKFHYKKLRSIDGVDGFILYSLGKDGAKGGNEEDSDVLYKCKIHRSDNTMHCFGKLSDIHLEDPFGDTHLNL